MQIGQKVHTPIGLLAVCIVLEDSIDHWVFEIAIRIIIGELENVMYVSLDLE